MYRRFVRAFAALILSGWAATGAAQERIVFATDWLAQAEHGGFYQALAEGLPAGARAEAASYSFLDEAARRIIDDTHAAFGKCLEQRRLDRAGPAGEVDPHGRLARAGCV